MSTGGPVKNGIYSTLKTALEPTYLEVNDNSSDHSSHRAMRERPGGAVESHFACVIVSHKFDGLGYLDRHRMVNTLLNDFFSGERGNIHALELKTKTPTEWATANPGHPANREQPTPAA